MNSRMPAVAGSFYPASPATLNTELGGFFAATRTSEEMTAKALIVPHAGYYYSGAIAAHAYARLKNNAIERVILLGPSHRVFLQGCAVPGYDLFTTPLGDIRVDRQNCQRLCQAGLAQQLDQAHRQEHALEVQLPFLQYRLTNDFQILPITVGEATPTQVGKVLTALADLPDSLIVISTDLSHYHPYAQARALDRDTISRIIDFNPNIKPEDACGCYALNGLLHFAQALNWRIKLLKHANSGDINHNKNEVVGYASFILY